jgi:uncharacterized membrane protein YccC
MQLHRRNFLSLLVKSEPGRPAIANGVRAVLCLGVPMVVGQILDRRELSLFFGLIAFFVNLANVGGSYQIKAKAMLAATAGIALSVLVGKLVSSVPMLAVVLIFGWGVAAGLASLYGNAGSNVGLVVGISFIVSLAQPGDIHTAGAQSLLALLAGGWAMLLSLILWPFQPDRLLRFAIADCFNAIASYIRAVRAEVDPSEHLIATSTALEKARIDLGTVRIGQSAQSWMDERLLVLIQDGDRVLGSAIALTDLLTTYAQHQEYPQVRPLIDDALDQFSLVLQSIGSVIAGKSASIDFGQLARIAEALKECQRQQRQAIGSKTNNTPLVALNHLVWTLDKLIKQLQYTAESATDLSKRCQKIHHRDVDLLLLVKDESQSPIDLLRDNLTFDSAIFCHAIRLGITLSIGFICYRLTNLPMGYWITLSIMFVLKPNLGGTFVRFFQRVGGTLLGAAIAAILLATISSKPILDIIIILNVFFGIALIAVNYGSSVVFFSIFVLLIADMTDLHDAMGWQFAGLRILNTLIGAGLAFGTHYLLWPNWERDRLPSQFATALQAAAAYFGDVMAVYQGAREYDSTIIGRRRQTGLAIGNAQASFQGLLREPKLSEELVEPVMTLLVYVGRFTSAVTVLAEHLERCRSIVPLPALATFDRQISLALEQLAEAVAERTLPLPLPDLEATLASIQPQIQAQRIDSPALSVVGFKVATVNRSPQPTPQISILQGSGLSANDYSILDVEIDQIVRRVTAMHSAIVRLKLSSKSR